MMAALSRALMALTAVSLGESRREWAFAMQAEFEAASEDRRPLTFAAGCLIAAWLEMPRHAEGRLVLANHILALGFLVPVAFLQFACAIGLSAGPDGLYGVLAGVGSQERYLADAQLSAIPALLIVWLLLGIGHLRLAWALLDGDWSRVASAGALIAASTLTLLSVMSLLLLDAVSLLLQAGVLPIELALILVMARWHARISPDAASAAPAW